MMGPWINSEPQRLQDAFGPPSVRGPKLFLAMMWFTALLLFAAYSVLPAFLLRGRAYDFAVSYGFYGLLAVLCFVVQAEFRPSRRQFGICRAVLASRRLWIALLAAIALAAAPSGLRLLAIAVTTPGLHLGLFGWLAYAQRSAPINRPHFWYGFVLNVVIDPPLEELFFRGYLYLILRQNWGPTRAAVVSSAIFGALHLSVWMFVWALVCIYLDNRGRSLLPSVALHIVNNVVAMVV